MFAKSSEEGIFLSNMYKRIIIIHMQSLKEIGTWKIGFIIFLSVIQRLIIFLSVIQRLIIFLSAIQRLIIFSKCNSAPHYFSKCEVSASLFFLSVSQRTIEFSFQKHYSAIASISWYEAHNFLICFDYFCY